MSITITRDDVKTALRALGVTNIEGIFGFEATLKDVTFHRHVKGESGVTETVTVPLFVETSAVS